MPQKKINRTATDKPKSELAPGVAFYNNRIGIHYDPLLASSQMYFVLPQTICQDCIDPKQYLKTIDAKLLRLAGGETWGTGNIDMSFSE